MHRIFFLSSFLSVATGQYTFAAQQLTLIDQFSTSGGIGLAFDAATDTLWTYGSDTLRQYSQTGTLLNTFADAPGEPANDADLDFVEEAFTLGTTVVPAGSLLFTNGETDVAEVYALDSSATQFGSLTTAFGNSHTVGSAYSSDRNTLFLLQDRVPTSALDNVVSEIDTVTGQVLNSFDLDDIESNFSIFYGDLEVSSTNGNLFLVSSSETSVLQLSPNGNIVQELTLASGSGGSLGGSGIALDDARSEFYIQSTDGTVYRYGLVPNGDYDSDGDVDGSDFLRWQREDGTLAGLGIWKMNYGPINQTVSMAIPEPSLITLAALNCCILAGSRRLSHYCDVRYDSLASFTADDDGVVV